MRNPVEHSCSPSLFNYLGKIANIEYSHIKILVKSPKDLVKTINNLNELGFCGVNVTCPYKVDCFKICSAVDNSCKNIGSVNTIKISGHRIIGYNTDGIAAIKSINEVRQITNGDNVVIFGAGGVARAIVYEISRITKNITIFNLDKEMSTKMLEFMGLALENYDLSNKELIRKYLENATLIINCTTLGMKPDSNDSIITEDDMNFCKNKKAIFFDVVFNPWETKFIKTAHKLGFTTVNGGKMLIHQAILAFKIWTGVSVDVKSINMNELQRILLDEINRG